MKSFTACAQYKAARVPVAWCALVIPIYSGKFTGWLIRGCGLCSVLLTETWQELRKLFLELDTNRDGTITLEDAVLSQVKLSSYANLSDDSV